jgi:hypothetical protein
MLFERRGGCRSWRLAMGVWVRGGGGRGHTACTQVELCGNAVSNESTVGAATPTAVEADAAKAAAAGGVGQLLCAGRSFACPPALGVCGATSCVAGCMPSRVVPGRKLSLTQHTRYAVWYRGGKCPSHSTQGMLCGTGEESVPHTAHNVCCVVPGRNASLTQHTMYAVLQLRQQCTVE